MKRELTSWRMRDERRGSWLGRCWVGRWGAELNGRRGEDEDGYSWGKGSWWVMIDGWWCINGKAEFEFEGFVDVVGEIEDARMDMMGWWGLYVCKFIFLGYYISISISYILWMDSWINEIGRIFVFVLKIHTLQYLPIIYNIILHYSPTCF